MSLDSLPRIRVDFNELVDSGLVLLSKTDRVECDDGNELVLEVGLEVIAFEHNAYGDGTAEYPSGTMCQSMANGHATHCGAADLLAASSLQNPKYEQLDWVLRHAAT